LGRAFSFLDFAGFRPTFGWHNLVGFFVEELYR
jgi:hypothetical protein